MNVYGKKRKWKFWLYGSATIAFVIIIYYSNLLINNIAREERRRIEIWADAIAYKAELVNYTEHFFERIKIEEGKRASILAQAIQRVNEAGLEEDLTFFVNIISSNSTIPSIIVDPAGRIDGAVNVDPEIQKLKYIWELSDYKEKFDSVKIHYDPTNPKKYIMIFYKESKIYSDLKVVLHNLIQSVFQEAVINSVSVPVIVTDETEQKIITYGKIDSSKINDPQSLAQMIEKMKDENKPIKIALSENQTCYVFYEESSVLKKIRLFPFFLSLIVVIFVGVAYLLFSVSRRSEQNQVWVGMSKETAHQLGTPISSLMAWNELLREQNVNNSIITEIDKDVTRLETIAQRFSKIGSVPELKDENLLEVIREFTDYLQTRIQKSVTIEVIANFDVTSSIPLNRYLFEWVIENLCKNSVDAMEGKGTIFIEITEDKKYVHIDIRDTGKGIPSKKIKNIFNPGYTTKSRGWGLGLTLAKRIINEYHKGKLFVKSSTSGIGTVMRISLRKS
jgi:hypothetical protein